MQIEVTLHHMLIMMKDAFLAGVRKAEEVRDNPELAKHLAEQESQNVLLTHLRQDDFSPQQS